MDDFSWWQWLLMPLTGVLVGFLNSLAGGGSTFSIPLMIFLGLPPTVANGTNRVGIFFGNFSSAYGLFRKGYLDLRLVLRLAPPVLLGAIGGTAAAVVIGDREFQILLSFAMLGVVLFSSLPRSLLGVPEKMPERLGWLDWLIFIGLGFYGAFMQVGMGFMFIIGILRVTGLDLVRVNALKNSMALVLIVLSSVAFIWADLVWWPVAILFSVGTLGGGWLGSRWQHKKGEGAIQWFIRITSVLLALKLLWHAIFDL